MNITQLRDRLLQAFADVEADAKKAKQVMEMSNAAAQILGSVRIQLTYSAMRNEQPEIEFLGETTGKPLLKSMKQPMQLITNENQAAK